ncbi:hypothetical protein [Shewanella ulleungensis]|uniref:hypothetical protein n=1 Tax=Shewanella ulleungensis TaxID=2282699 RepID=UPI003D7A84EA
MKKFTLTALSITTLFVGSASAVDIDLSGNVATVCSISSSTTAINSLVGNAGGTINGINLSCNDFDGATVTMISNEGGLQGIDSEDLVIPYKAVLTPVGLTPLVLDLSYNGWTGNNDISVSKDYAGSALLGGTSAELVITTGTSTHSGAQGGIILC